MNIALISGISELRVMVQRFGFTHLWIALAAGMSAAGSLTAFSQSEQLEVHDWPFLWAVAACAGWVYTFQRWMKSTRKPEQMPPIRLEFMRKNGGRLGALWTLLAFLASCNWLLDRHEQHASHDFMFWLLIFFSVILGIGYAFNPFGNGLGWRERPRLKLPAIALTWTIATVIFPAVHCGLNLWDTGSMNLWGVALSQTLFVAGITVPFDVRDLDLDPPEFQTWPQRWGASRSIRIALFLLAISAAGFVLFDLNLGRAMISLLALPLVAWTVRPRKEAVYSLMLDGLFILQGSAVLWLGIPH